MTSIFISYEMIEDLSKEINDEGEFYINTENFKLFCKIFPNNYIVCHFLMMASFILRCQRIIECCKLNYDERIEIKEFYNKRYLFKENHYIKILFGIMTFIIFLNFILNLQFSDKDLNIIPFHFTNCMKDPKQGQYYVSIMWVIINFLEDVILVTYTYVLLVNHVKQMIKLELFTFMLVWIVYPNFLRFTDFIYPGQSSYGQMTGHWSSYICCGFLWICLLLNGYLPVIISFINNNSITYHFNPKLTNNLYLFLSNEICFYAFHEYTSEREVDLFFLNLYSSILKYKLKYTLEPDYYKVLDEATDIYQTYFSSSSSKYLDNELVNKTKSNCQMINKDEFTYDMFDDALTYSYEFLEDTFKKYKRSEEYQILIDNLNLNSYIQCKMCNTGLISRY